ncbi:MAG: YkgJ family cysteine cluster protein [Thermoplasmatota archaeon]
MNNIPRAEVLRRLNNIYLQIPPFECKHCQRCSNPIFWFYPEELNIRTYLNQYHLLYMTYSEEEFKHHHMKCPYLSENRCQIYPVRPIICRLQGIIPELYCPNNTKPLLSQDQYKKIIKGFNDLLRDTDGMNEVFSTRKEIHYKDVSLTKMLNK